MSNHTLNVWLDRDTVCLSLACHAKDGATCRRACAAGCEDSCVNPDKHIKSIGYCLAVEWTDINNDLAERYAGGDELRLYDGMPVAINWTGDNYEWTAIK